MSDLAITVWRERARRPDSARASAFRIRAVKELMVPSPRLLWAAGCVMTVAITGLATVSDHLLTSHRLGRTLAALDGSASAALTSPKAAPAVDVTRALALLGETPQVRADRAVYQAALLRPEVAAPLLRQRSLLAAGDLVAAGRLVETILSSPSSGPKISHTLRRHVRRGAAQSRPPTPMVAPGYVDAVLADAAWNVGVDLAYLRRTAARESGFNAYAAASTSSARGLFQFLDRSWLDAVSRYGRRHGLGREAGLVRFDTKGRPFVADPRERARILALRFDPGLNARLAAETTLANRQTLRDAIGREPTRGELYAAHVLGPTGAARLIAVAYRYPTTPAALLFPDAAAANRRLFYASGRARPCLEVLLGFH